MTYTDPRSGLSDGTSHFLLHSGRYPADWTGDVNTYSVFAETFRTVIAPIGTAGIITPTGLATDKTTAPFFADTLSSQPARRLLRLRKRGQDLSRRPPSLPVRGDRYGRNRTDSATNAIRLPQSDMLPTCPRPRFELAAEEVLALNPNTGTLPDVPDPSRRRHHSRHLPTTSRSYPRRMRRRQSLGSVVRKALRHGQRLRAVPTAT